MLIETTLWHWIALVGGIAAFLALDLGVFHRKTDEAHAPNWRQSLGWTLFWAALALALAGWIWKLAPITEGATGTEAAVRFMTAYLVEWSLSVDNVFVFAVIFNYFHVPRQYQYRVLFWGVVGAIGMRLGMVLLGYQLISEAAPTGPVCRSGG